MFHPSHYLIRPAVPADRDLLERLAVLDSTRPLRGRALVGEMDGEVVAAVSLEDKRAIADPFRPTAKLVTLLRTTLAD